MTLSTMTLGIDNPWQKITSHYAGCAFFIVTLNVIRLNVIMLNGTFFIVMLSVVRLNVGMLSVIMLSV
jgi:hypothetical protein